MSFDEYQDATVETAVYPEAGQGTEIALAYVGLGLVNEAGEVAGKIKKIIRDSGGTVTDEARSALKAELGDTLYYLARVADELDIGLDAVAESNISKLQSRKSRGTIKGSGDNR